MNLGTGGSFAQMTLDSEASEGLPDNPTTFAGNMKLPIHRWFRYSAGFSAKWVEKTLGEILEARGIRGDACGDFVLLDPFAGSGTTLLEADSAGVRGVGFESHPLISRVARAKLMWDTDAAEFRKFAGGILESARGPRGEVAEYPEVVYKCYTGAQLKQIDALRQTLRESEDESGLYCLSWLAFLSILRAASHVGTAQWQYLLPNKSKSNVKSAFEAFDAQVELMSRDIAAFQQKQKTKSANPRSAALLHDSREAHHDFDNSVDLVITSPPYANNYDYADATRLELCVLGEIGGWGDLHEAVRKNLIRSSTQHVSRERKQTYEFLTAESLKPIKDEMFQVCKKLDAVKDLHGGKKNYHTMVALYFLDLSKVIMNLRRMCKIGSDVCMVIGDSAPYGVYVPVDEWLGKLAAASGFSSCSFIKNRDRNVKWKNRKHRIPLKEGQLWMKG